MVLTQCCSAEKCRPRTIAEAMRSRDTGGGKGGYWHGMVRDGAGAWHLRPQGGAQLSNGLLKNQCRPGAGHH